MCIHVYTHTCNSVRVVACPFSQHKLNYHIEQHIVIKVNYGQSAYTETAN